MSNKQPTYINIADGLYTGNRRSAKDLNFLADADISVIVNMTGKSLKQVEHVEIFDVIIPGHVLMDTEFPKVMEKLEAVKQLIKNKLSNSRNVLICCIDGKNMSMLAAGYFLIEVGSNFNSIVDDLEMKYLTANERKSELEFRDLLLDEPELLIKYEESQPCRVTYEAEKSARRSKLCLTNASYRKLLRIKGGAKK